MVSIRSRLFGREKPNSVAYEIRQTWFQSAPGFSAGRNPGGQTAATEAAVSIRSRLFGREKRGAPPSRPRRRCGFNPLPAFRPGETRWPTAPLVRRPWFQSAPGFSAGRNLTKPPRGGRNGCFNPLPAFRPGETPPRQPLAAKANLSCAARTFRGRSACVLVEARAAQQFSMFSIGNVSREPSGEFHLTQGPRKSIKSPTAPRSPPPGTRRTASPEGGPIR